MENQKHQKSDQPFIPIKPAPIEPVSGDQGLPEPLAERLWDQIIKDAQKSPEVSVASLLLASFDSKQGNSFDVLLGEIATSSNDAGIEKATVRTGRSLAMGLAAAFAEGEGSTSPEDREQEMQAQLDQQQEQLQQQQERLEQQQQQQLEQQEDA